jgi:hypothetical protein
MATGAEAITDPKADVRLLVETEPGWPILFPPPELAFGETAISNLSLCDSYFLMDLLPSMTFPALLAV